MSKKLAVATLLYSLDYLPGVLTLGHQVNKLLRIKTNSNNIETCLLVTESLYNDELTVNSKNALHTLYRRVILINPLMENDMIMERNNYNLDILKRPELAFTLIKIKLWNQTIYNQILYLDADTLPMSVDLFNLFEQYQDQTCLQVAASPDIGWPDMFNSGVMLLTPNEKLYHQLHIFTIDNVSIDGADQGILNQFFNQNCRNQSSNINREWQTLSFLYNVTTPNTGYQCPPAMKYFGKDIKLIHFIGNNKPWKVTLEVDSENSNYAKEWYNVYEEYNCDVILDQGLVNLRIKEVKPYQTQTESEVKESIDNNNQLSCNETQHEQHNEEPQQSSFEEQKHEIIVNQNVHETHAVAEPEKIDLPLPFKDWLTTFIKKEEEPVQIRQCDNSDFVTDTSKFNSTVSNEIRKPKQRELRVYERQPEFVERQFSETGFYNNFDQQDEESIISEDENVSSIGQPKAEHAQVSAPPPSEREYVPNYKFDWENTGYQRNVQRIFPNDIFEYEVEESQNEAVELDDVSVDRELNTAKLRSIIAEREEMEEEEEEEDMQERSLITGQKEDSEKEEDELYNIRKQERRNEKIMHINEILATSPDDIEQNYYPPATRQFPDYDTPIIHQTIPEEPIDYNEDYGDE
ncbi:similar to Saccharomyces cerevisiae YJL137C GLG2 Self-glucosylating initiator of glycogen synthesis, also glucosylates n-dodecyl-beta-D-maltoside [Maudiozyma saulgeensis]|uniref:glycogenin glucosyltransferase n=1 Tax=Maudiozyma saulgeensis TaxID=1789683 RepID=A0A1X7R0U0_9SACH|nr:similar to Saccharomyces cerevisiae YJL137C GLG2 Self-glucosylating initiator of glycogen synthesis, also glucosylates n-dodecyl-beta-D-maltoside [Kazachstania saulgeensis]